MSPEGVKRVDRLIAWIKSHDASLLHDATGEPCPKKVSGRLGGVESYWYGVLSKEKSRTFGASAARKVEAALGMPNLYLEGGTWPFEVVSQELFESLTPRQQGAVERVMLMEIERLTGKQLLRS